MFVIFRCIFELITKQSTGMNDFSTSQIDAVSIYYLLSTSNAAQQWEYFVVVSHEVLLLKYKLTAAPCWGYPSSLLWYMKLF